MLNDIKSSQDLSLKKWQMVKSETHRDAEILVRNPSPIIFGEKSRDSKKVKTNHEKTRFRDLSKTFPKFRDPAETHVFRGTIRHPCLSCSVAEEAHESNDTQLASFFSQLRILIYHGLLALL